MYENVKTMQFKINCIKIDLIQNQKFETKKLKIVLKCCTRQNKHLYWIFLVVIKVNICEFYNKRILKSAMILFINLS